MHEPVADKIKVINHGRGCYEHVVPQNTDAWYALRASKPTASKASSLVTSCGLPSDGIDEYALELANEMYAGRPIDGFSGNQFTERGHEFEDLARRDYEMKMQMLTRRVGFCTNKLMQYGCSPDDFAGEDGAVEYKCKTGVVHSKAVLDYNETCKVPTVHVAQVQMVMFITGKKWCDLVFYHPYLPGVTIRIYPDKDFVRVLKKQLKEVIVKRNIIYNKLKSL